MEQRLKTIFTQVLGLEGIGRRDNFFHLGGHSLLAAQALARVRESLGIDLELRSFWEAPTVAALGSRIEALRGSADAAQSADREEIELIGAADLLAQLQSLDIRLLADGERLRVNAPRGGAHGSPCADKSRRIGMRFWRFCALAVRFRQMFSRRFVSVETTNLHLCHSPRSVSGSWNNWRRAGRFTIFAGRFGSRAL